MNRQFRPGDENTRPDGWVVTIMSGDIGVSARPGLEPSDDDFQAALAGLLEDARRQARLAAQVAARYRPH